jgi:hypothetical protein
VAAWAASHSRNESRNISCSGDSSHRMLVPFPLSGQFLGILSIRSATMLRWMKVEPPAIAVPRAW